jgi:UDP-2,4-diacetamido-2,4,6-trideoxy-beta-L-altropyranose hydrolase
VNALVVRADASSAIGMGHAMRCLALVQALADETGGAATFLMADPPDAFVGRAGDEDAHVIGLAAAPGTLDDAEETAELARTQKAAWVVLDGYRFDGAYQQALAGGVRVLMLDDHAHLDRYHVPLLLNQNAGATAEPYHDRAPDSRLLLGPSYVLLRREFRTWDGPQRETRGSARRILVTLGGADADDVTSRVLRALASYDDPHEVQVLVGPANPNLDAIERAAAAGQHPVELVVDARDLPRRMAWADLAVAAAGSTSWELARVGTPQLAIVLADNQRPVAAGLEHEGVAISLGWHADLRAERIIDAVRDLARDPARRAELSRRGRELIDGRGTLRVLAAMEHFDRPERP